MIHFPVLISKHQLKLFVSFQKLLHKIISELYVHLNRYCSLSFPCPSRASLLLRKMRQAALSIFVAGSHSPINSAPFNPHDVMLMELPLKNKFSLAIRELPAVMDMTEPFSGGCFWICCWGETLVVWFLTAFGFKCEIPGLILDSSCIGGTATRVAWEGAKSRESLSWHEALFTQSCGTNKQTKKPCPKQAPLCNPLLALRV